MVHLANAGDRYFSGGYAGTRGSAIAVEAIRVTSVPVPDVSVQLQVHQQDVGDSHWVAQHDLAGSTGKGRRLEGFSAKLEGKDAPLYDLKYTAHLQDSGDVGPYANGAFCGTRGQCRRLEGVQMWLEPRTARAVFQAMMTVGER